MLSLVGEDCGINLSETACCRSGRSFQVHPPTHGSKSCQVIIPFYPAGGKSILDLELGCSVWLKPLVIFGFIWWWLCLGQGPLLSSRLLILNKLKKWDSIDLWQAPACLLYFSHEVKEEEMEMNPACFLSAVIGITSAKSGVKFELWRADSLFPTSRCPSCSY